VAYVKAAQAREAAASPARQRLEVHAGLRNAASKPSWLAAMGGKALVAGVIALLFVAAKLWWPGSRVDEAVAPGEVAEIEIYTTSYCGICKAAKSYMTERGIAYTEYDVEADIDRRREFYKLGGKGVPLIFVRGQRMEGFDVREFERLRAQGL
jgi:glutaredoxin